MNTEAVRTAAIEYQETILRRSQILAQEAEGDFEAYMERAREVRVQAAKDGYLTEELRLRENQKALRRAEQEETELAEAEKFKARRKKSSQSKMELFQAQTLLPQNYREQISQALMGRGQAESGLRGLELSGRERPTGVLKDLLENLKGEGSLWRLDRECLPALGRIFSSSGVSGEKTAELLAKLSQGPLTLDRVLKAVSQAESDLALAQTQAGEAADPENSAGLDLAQFLNLNSPSESSLEVTSEGLGAMGQFFLSLGMSAEAVEAVTSTMQPGETFTSQSLRNLLGSLDESLAPCLSDGDTESLFLALKSMGASNENLNLFQNYLAQAPEAKLDDLLSFLAVLEQPQPKFTGAGTNLAADVQALITGSSKDTEMAKTPVFNEIILKLASLGDRELDSDFTELSPALQALRGGLSGMRGSSSGSDSYDGRHQNGREKERERMSMTEVQSPFLTQGLEGSGFSQVLASEWSGLGARESLARQLETKLLYSAARGIHRLKMDLDPEELGRLDVELKVVKDKMTAHIRAESAETFEALEKEIASLKASLKEAGLEMNLTLSYDGQAESDRRFSRTAPEAMTAAGRSQGAGEAEDVPPAAWTVSRDSRLLDRVI